jgi:uncharacterized protein
MIPPDTATPLSQSELEQLEALLDSDIFRGEAMLLDEMQGLFFAVASSPDLIAPSQWMPEALGETPAFEDADQAQQVLELVMRFYNQSVAAAATDSFDLILYRTETEEVDYAAWCGGYLTGVDLAETDWYDAGDPDEVGELLFPLLVLADALPEEEKRAIKPAEWRRLVQSCEETLADTLVRIHDYWAVVRAPPQTVRRDAPKTGRNDPCPCGSGRKFKQCCGAAGVLH